MRSKRLAQLRIAAGRAAIRGKYQSVATRIDTTQIFNRPSMAGSAQIQIRKLTKKNFQQWHDAVKAYEAEKNTTGCIEKRVEIPITVTDAVRALHDKNK